MAPSSLIFTMAQQSTNIAGLPRPSGSTLLIVDLLLPLDYTPPASPRPSGSVVSPPFTMAPLSIGSTVGHIHGCGLAPAWLYLLQLPPVFSLAPPDSSVALHRRRLGHLPASLPALRHCLILLQKPSLLLFRPAMAQGSVQPLGRGEKCAFCFTPAQP